MATPQEKLQNLEQSLGSDHPDTLKAIELCAADYAASGNNDDAKKLYRKHIHLNQERGDQKASTRAMYNLALMLNNEEKYADAEPLLQQVLPMLLERSRPEGPARQVFLQQELGSMRELVRALDGQGKHSEAEPLAKQTIEQANRLEDDSTRAEHLASMKTSSSMLENILAT